MDCPLGAMMQLLREERGLSRPDMAARMQISSHSLCQIERGYRVPAWNCIVLIARALSVQPWVLFLTKDELTLIRTLVPGVLGPH